jgi:AAA+ superfamily predicted ATPase
VALPKTRYPIIVHDQAFRIITCQPPIFSLASSTTKTGRHDIAEILLKVALKRKQKKPNHINVHHTVSKSTCNKYFRSAETFYFFVALPKTRYPIIVHDQAFRIITCQPPIESGRCRGRDRTEVELCNKPY